MDESRDLFQGTMGIHQVNEQSRLLREVVRRVTPQVEGLITREKIHNLSKIYLTGCGDSHYVGLAARLAFDMLARIPTEPAESLEFSRYLADFMPANSLVIAVSNSGEVSRTIETLKAAHHFGADTIAITGKPASRLAQAAAGTIVQTVPELGESWNPYSIGALGLGNYTASLATLYLIAIRLGVMQGHVSPAEAEAALGHLIEAAQIIEQTVAANNEAVLEFAREVWHQDTFFILGGGPSYAVALFAAAKLFEQPHANGVPQELEEWAHEQYFLTRPGTTHIFVIAPPGRSRDRALEQIRGAQDMGGSVIAICDQDDEEMQALADRAFPIYGALPEAFTPLTYIVPGQLFATHLHQLRGRPALFPPYDLERLREVNFRQIFRSRLWDRYE